jgi:hypothetical protein
LETDIEGIEEPAMELGVEQTGLRELFAVSRMESAVLAELLIALVEQRFGGVEHRVVRAACGEFGADRGEQDIGCLNGAFRFFEEGRVPSFMRL